MKYEFWSVVLFSDERPNRRGFLVPILIFKSCFNINSIYELINYNVLRKNAQYEWKDG